MAKDESEETLLRQVEELRQELYRFKDKLGVPELPELIEEISLKLDRLVVELMKRRRAKTGVR
ncbi:MAG: hypothetical protein QME70_12140 [Bacillota bacterium]|nr:hypothetical protein [Bacillota bacterium]